MSEDIAIELETILMSAQSNLNCLILQVCIWNVNVRNVESEECGAVYVGIFS
jgi:hypothetical protein